MPDTGVITGLRPLPQTYTFVADDGLLAPASAYFGIRIDSAVNLAESREYAGLDRVGRLHLALSEQHQFFSGLLGLHGQAAFDLRILATPDRPALEIVVIGRTWGATEGAARASAEAIRGRLRTSIPRHLNASVIDTRDELFRMLAPFHGQRVDAALITKRELIGVPSRRDAGRPYYFSISPFNWVETQWNPLFAALTAAASPVSVSVGLFPVATPRDFNQKLADEATFYSRLAREDERKGGLYYGSQKLPPDAFAVEAERVFHDYLRRCGHAAFDFRVQVTSPALPLGIVEAVGTAISAPESRTGSHLDQDRVAAGFETRWLTGQYGSELAQWNLAAVDTGRSTGRPDIWAHPAAPASFLSHLSQLGDAGDAACLFRFPVAVDGTVPGFPVRRGQFGNSEAYPTTGPAITIGNLPETGRALRLPLSALTKHALIAGSTGSGKTTTVLELLRQLWVDHQVPFLVIEPVNSDADDYRRLQCVPGFERLRLLTLGDEDCAPLRFNPFEVPRGVLVSEHAANLLACFKAAFGLWEPLPSIYQDALNSTYLRAGILNSERASGEQRNWPTVVEFLKAMGAATADLGYAGEVKANIEAASIRRAQQLTSGPAASTFMTDQSLDIAALLAIPTIIELKSLGNGDEQALMIALLLNAMTEHFQANRLGQSGLAHITVIEEAHRLLSRTQRAGGSDAARAKEQAAEAFANTLAENRKYGEGVIIAEQIPTKLVVDAVKNTNLKMMHRLTAEEDRDYLGESMGLDDSQKRFTTRLATGEALVYSDQYAEAAHVTVVPSVPFGRPPAAPRVASPPFNSCAPCRSKCLYRGAALSLVRPGQLRDELTSTRRALTTPGLTPEEVAARWETLVKLLRETVKTFAALPNLEPGLSDAAYCLFLHSVCAEDMNHSPEWPPAVARRLGLSDDAVEVGAERV